MRIIATVLLALALAIATATVASAQTVEGYSNQGGDIQSQVEGGGGIAGTGTDTASGVAGTQTTASDGGSLPFTGLDLALIALAGGALVAVGVGMRRLTRAPESA
jgi:hypothetical protein